MSSLGSGPCGISARLGPESGFRVSNAGGNPGDSTHYHGRSLASSSRSGKENPRTKEPTNIRQLTYQAPGMRISYTK